MASDENEAIKQAATAAYKQSGIEHNINEIIKDNVPKDVQKYAVQTATIVNILQHRRLELKWEW